MKSSHADTYGRYFPETHAATNHVIMYMEISVRDAIIDGNDLRYTWFIYFYQGSAFFLFISLKNAIYLWNKQVLVYYIKPAYTYTFYVKIKC